tara:strand:- start:4603 stop:5553 length:951 start_codon:yes stop_codon:yes gene_type:complete
MNNTPTPNSNPSNNSEIKSRIDFWVGVVVGYESQKDQIENGLGWRYKVRIMGENSDNDQVKDEELSYAVVLLPTTAGSGAAYKLRSVRISQGDTVYGIKGPHIPTTIIGVEARTRQTVISNKKFGTLSGFYGELSKNGTLSGEFNEQLGPATPGGKPIEIDKSKRKTAVDKLNEIGIDPNVETGVISNSNKKLTPKKSNSTLEYVPGQNNLTRDILDNLEIEAKTGVTDPQIYIDAMPQAVKQSIIDPETAKVKINEMKLIQAQEDLDTSTYVVGGVEYDTKSGLPIETIKQQAIEEMNKKAGEDFNSEDYYQYDP